MINLPTPTYVERSNATDSKAVAAEISKIVKAYGGLRVASDKLKTGTIDGANLSREIGLHLQGLCGHETMTFMFWKTHCEKALPFDFEAARFFMRVARKMVKKAESLEEVWEFAQPLLICDDSLPEPKRAGIQQASTVPALQRLCCSFAMLRKPFDKIFNAAPMEKWEQDDVRLFLSETEWLAEERARAEKLLKLK